MNDIALLIVLVLITMTLIGVTVFLAWMEERDNKAAHQAWLIRRQRMILQEQVDGCPYFVSDGSHYWTS